MNIFTQALKALILERMGKPEESLGICLEAKELLQSNNSVHVDDLTLSTLQIVFQRLDHCLSKSLFFVVFWQVSIFFNREFLANVISGTCYLML